MTESKPQRPTLLSPTSVVGELTKLNGESANGWRIEDGALTRTFEFQNFYETMAFVNAVAYIANRHDHHPTLGVGYNRCSVAWVTHEPPGLTRLDFLAAADVSALRPDVTQ
jgi:4a-hydroxytetrahydrobiopterin dehydratase